MGKVQDRLQRKAAAKRGDDSEEVAEEAPDAEATEEIILKDAAGNVITGDAEVAPSVVDVAVDDGPKPTE